MASKTDLVLLALGAAVIVKMAGARRPAAKAAAPRIPSQSRSDTHYIAASGYGHRGGSTELVRSGVAYRPYDDVRLSPGRTTIIRSDEPYTPRGNVVGVARSDG